MAWQLIYTSAPRSLEAGRSGFGTVARHRAISPLLVPAIERVSQFSRLPGTDAGRVIFAHRIVNIAGGRFHILSAIRDAGADYTGRTNHIAHHLVVEAREVAQLGGNGPSPADVLLAMRWMTSWDESPRYFEASDEILLATISQQTDGSAWHEIAGSSDQAALLASAEASRGAYLIQPGGMDLRAAFGESLRFMPDRLWQITFTTSLQPSDEPADFRWISIEEQSPLRSRLESSGRPVFDLSRPDSLPLVEIVQNPARSQARQDFAPRSAPPQSDRRTGSRDESPLDLPRIPIHASESRKLEKQDATSATAKRAQRNWRKEPVSIVLAVLAGFAALFFLVIRPLMHEKQEVTDQRNSVRAEVLAAFSNENSGLANTIAGLPVNQLSVAHALAKAAHGTAVALKQETLPPPLDDAKSAFEQAQKSLGNISPSFANLFALHKNFYGYQKQIGDIKNAQATPEQVTQLREIYSALLHDNTGLPMEVSRDIRQRLTRKVEVLWPERLHKLLNSEIKPTENYDWFRTQLDALPTSLSKSEGAKQTVTLLEAWRCVNLPQPDQEKLQTMIDDNRKSGVLPPWIINAANGKISTVTKYLDVHPAEIGDSKSKIRSKDAPELKKPALSQRAPFYFVQNLDVGYKVKPSDLKSAASFFLQEGVSASARKELLMPAAYPGMLFRKNVADGEIFVFDRQAGTISVGKDKKPIVYPCFLIAKNSEKNELFTICIIPPGIAVTDCLLEKVESGISPVGEDHQVDFQALRLPLFQNVSLELQLTKEFALPGKPSSMRIAVDLESGLISTRALRDELHTRKATFEKERGQQTKAPRSDKRKEFLDLKHKFLEESGLNNTIKQKRQQLKDKKALTTEEQALGSDEDPLIVQYGGCIEAFTGSKGFQAAQDLFNAGQSLRSKELKSQDQGKKLKEASGAIRRVINNLRSIGEHKDEKPKYESPLNTLMTMVNGPLSETSEAKEKDAAEDKQQVLNVKALDDQIAMVNSHTLAEAKQFPKGIYRIFATLQGGASVPLLDIEIK